MFLLRDGGRERGSKGGRDKECREREGKRERTKEGGRRESLRTKLMDKTLHWQ